MYYLSEINLSLYGRLQVFNPSPCTHACTLPCVFTHSVIQSPLLSERLFSKLLPICSCHFFKSPYLPPPIELKFHPVSSHVFGTVSGYSIYFTGLFMNQLDSGLLIEALNSMI